ncbi:MAG: S-methyl-5'-thioadenosine phosphorylase [Phycisphaerales bacterium]|nr:MAG: S-methyl-5'-thioadenosine phosphorylase [Phycisphaerales bacterium]
MTDPKTHVRIGIIGGTGLADRLLVEMVATSIPEKDLDTPFGKPSGPIVAGTFGGAPVAILQRHGEGHLLNPAHVPYRANVFALKKLGCTHIVASGATGSLREDIAPGDLVLCDQIIDRTRNREKTFYENAAVHVEFADPCCPVMRQWLMKAADSIDGTRVHRAGTYVCMEGPAFSTRAESEMYRQWGADVVGMTALPEARLVREAEMAYALIALPTDYDCWRPRKEEASSNSLLEEIISNLNRATQASIALIKAALSDVSPLASQPSPAHDALKLAIWSDKSKIDPAQIERLRVLWRRHFE